MTSKILTPDHPEAYCTTFTLHNRACWITVNNLSVHICKLDGGVIANIYPKGSEDDESLGSTFAFFNEAEEES